MKLTLALPVLGVLALFAALPDSAQARDRSSFDVSVGFGYSSSNRGYSRHHHGGYHDRGYDRGHHYSPRTYYAPRPVYRSSHYYSPAPRVYYRDYDYYRPVYRAPARYYYRDSYYDDCY